MNTRSIRTFLISTFIGAIIPALIWVSLKPSDTTSDKITTPSPSPKPTIKLPEFKITALQLGRDTRQIISCEDQKCQPLPAQPSSDTPAVTDGVSWYYYETVEDRNGIDKLQLRRSWINSDQSDLIIEQTELVEPRGLFISPDNKKVAFWMDNISRGNKGQTELWIYNSSDNGTKLVAENINRKGVLTKPRWNRTSTHLFFLGETIIENTNQDTVHVVSIHTSTLTIPFSDIDWNDKNNLISDGAVDISRTGQTIAYVEPKLIKNVLHTQNESAVKTETKIRGKVPYLQWLTEDTLLYVVQGKHTFTFWKVSNGTHKHIAKYQGEFQSARADAQGKYLVFNIKHSNNINRTLALDIESGYIEPQGNLPDTDGHTYLIHFESKDKSNIAGATDQIDDELIAGFIDKHLSEISQENVQPQSFIITNQPNTVFIDYITNDKQQSRLLLHIQDAVHVEWTIIARYQEQSGEWIRTQGGGLSEPKALRLYEWEVELDQWVLKENYNSANKEPIK